MAGYLPEGLELRCRNSDVAEDAPERPSSDVFAAVNWDRRPSPVFVSEHRGTTALSDLPESQLLENPDDLA